ncbi:IS1595 family transposase [Candidatus Acetothermia bacterium]|nr:IS1595 family transposase [Candidatus Acetothermia bacterium]
MGQRLLAGSHLTNRALYRLIRLFSLEVPANKAAREVGVNRHTAERVYTQIRLALVRACEREALLAGEVEVDESYFGGHRKGRRGRGAAGKVIVFGILKRNGRVYTRPVPDVSRRVLRAIIRQRVPLGSTAIR